MTCTRYMLSVCVVLSQIDTGLVWCIVNVLHTKNKFIYRGTDSVLKDYDNYSNKNVHVEMLKLSKTTPNSWEMPDWTWEMPDYHVQATRPKC